MLIEGAKASLNNACLLTLLPLQGALYRLILPRALPWAKSSLHKIGCARHSSSKLGFALTCTIFAPPGRALNACYPMAVNMPSSRCALKGQQAFKERAKRATSVSRCALKGRQAFKERAERATSVSRCALKGQQAFKERAEGPASA